MLKNFTCRNYKNFQNDISIDFSDTAGYQFNSNCITDDKISKMIIYGRNATGKTNLGNALMDIYISLLRGRYFRDGESILNADSKENIASFSYTFQFDGQELSYCYTRFDSRKLRDEKLSIDGKCIFSCDYENEPHIIDNHLELIHAETAKVDRFLQAFEGEDEEGMSIQSLSFLGWLISNVAIPSDSILIKMMSYIQRMIMVTVGSSMIYSKRMYDRFFEKLDNVDALRELEEFLNAMGVKCKLLLEKLPDGQRELYFMHNKPIPFFENASSGTMALVSLYRRLFSNSWEPSFMYLDEFDAFYHYEMAEKLIRFFKQRYPKCQIILTTHNTNLMTNQLMRPDCLFILSREGSLTALCHATQRELREGHNLEKMYISGEFAKYE